MAVIAWRIRLEVCAAYSTLVGNHVGNMHISRLFGPAIRHPHELPPSTVTVARGLVRVMAWPITPAARSELPE
jgi:hypothetical protein